MSNAKTIKSFVKGFLAILKGDSDTVQAEKVFRQAQSALNTHISNCNGDTIDFEDKVTAAEEALQFAKVNNGVSIANRTTYVENLLNAKNNLTTAQDALKKHKAKITFLKEQLAELESDVVVEEQN
jgi:DNA repair ATPase RecN